MTVPVLLLAGCLGAGKTTAINALLQPGCDADVVVFDLDAIGERATFQHMNRPAQGIHELLVNGQRVIAGGDLVLAARPGRPVRGEARA